MSAERRVSESRLDDAIVVEQQAWGSPESQAYYRQNRNRPEDLYPSERYFLPDVLAKVGTMLDVGCAAGGFASVVMSFNPRVRYTGADVLPAFVEQARREHPDSSFFVTDGVHFETPPGAFDLVHASGVLHLNGRYRDMVAAMWAQTSRYLLCDLRLTRGRTACGRMESPFGEATPVSLPYVVLNVDDALNLFRALEPRPDVLRVRGYRHRASGSAVLDDPDIVMAFFLAEKGNAGRPGSTPVEVIEIDG